MSDDSECSTRERESGTRLLWLEGREAREPGVKDEDTRKEVKTDYLSNNEITRKAQCEYTCDYDFEMTKIRFKNVIIGLSRLFIEYWLKRGLARQVHFFVWKLKLNSTSCCVIHV